jgi:glucosamine--fructose-6-phosphate aminotransferase (isomerizing)
MCGIVGATGTTDALAIVMEGLKQLEYRGYDSGGVAVLTEGTVHLRKIAGKLNNLSELLVKAPLPAATTCIGHTRWATHGEASSVNAHPHQQPHATLVHNGILENYQALKQQLEQAGCAFASQTDSEVIAAYLSHQRASGKTPQQALQNFLTVAEGAFALAIIFPDKPNTLYATRRSAPLAIGLGDGMNFIASDPLALAAVTKRFMFLDDDQIAKIEPGKVSITNAHDEETPLHVHTLDLSETRAGKAGYPHFMLKEIYEQPAVVGRILSHYLKNDTLSLPELPFQITEVPHISIVACGTAYLAGQMGKTYIEQLAGVRVEVDMASEFRYRQPPLQKGGVFIAVSQSGETADTLAALEYAKAHGQHIVTLTNTPSSSMARASDLVLPLHAEAEIAVASTKAFSAMVVCLLLLALRFAEETCPQQEATPLIQSLKELPNKLTQTLNRFKGVEALADKISHASSMLYLGRGPLATLAYEGALKIKEISYIHAEAYPAGEMKHGPIALVEHGLPVVNLAASNDGLFEKTLSNLQEIKARHGHVILITDEAGFKAAGHLAEDTLTVPTTHPLLMPLLMTVPLQLLAYYVALAKGANVDQPRNLAKSVTVE